MPLLVEGNKEVEEEVVMASMPILVEEKVERKKNGGKVMEGVQGVLLLTQQPMVSYIQKKAKEVEEEVVMASMPILVEEKVEEKKNGGKVMEGVPGVLLWTQQPMVSYIQKKAKEGCNWSMNGFPGGKPVSMDRQNIEFLKEAPYKV